MFCRWAIALAPSRFHSILIGLLLAMLVCGRVVGTRTCSGNLSSAHKNSCCGGNGGST
jgi:hypothetical protein